MAPLKAIFPFSPFSRFTKWECCRCKQWNTMNRNYCCQQSCKHPVCADKCTVFSKQGHVLPVGLRIPANWTCQNKKHLPETLMNTQMIHSIAELLVSEEVKCWCQAPVFTSDAVYDHWGNLMATELMSAEFADCLFVPEAPRLEVSEDGQKELAAAALKDVAAMAAWTPILAQLEATRPRKSVDKIQCTAANIAGGLKIKGSAGKNKRKAETLVEDAVKKVGPVRSSKRLKIRAKRESSLVPHKIGPK